MSQKKTRLLIFIVAYNAEHHIESVLDRIPKEIYQIYDYEILIIDDSSKDQTFAKANAYKLANEQVNLKVLYNPINQGYGGNQKLGYTYAVRHGFDQVVLLHGDGQYAPEVMDDLIRPLAAGEADAVFGSRMMQKGDALKGGMPYYKYIGNKILTGLQNRILGASLSEFHSGYRAYSVAALARLPFDRNSNDFHFDTQIIIQFLLADFRIKEIAIPTFYGDEICHVNGIQYGWNVLKHSLISQLHKKSVFYNRAFDINQRSDYSLKLGYESSHTYAIDAVQEGSTVLDIGAGMGFVATELKKKGCKVTGMDYVDPPDGIFEAFYKTDLDDIDLEFKMDHFDHVLMLDVIEHLKEPELFMDAVRARMGMHQPRFIVTTPNIAFAFIRLQLLMGNFNYGKQGILDMTHKRLFTFKSLRVFFEQTGYQIKRIKGVPAPFPKALGDNAIARLLVALNKAGIAIWKAFFSYQIYIEVEPLPVVDSLLELAISTSSEKALSEAEM
ncbi:MAG: glycosyltransferase [Saprospiraceae bacterium]|nr:glycosyltransferase [Saprospiraceae bacterium]